jgi:hypothetical protein
MYVDGPVGHHVKEAFSALARIIPDIENVSGSNVSTFAFTWFLRPRGTSMFRMFTHRVRSRFLTVANRKARRLARKDIRCRLHCTRLEDRTVPSNVPFTLPRPNGPQYFTSAAAAADGSGAILYSACSSNGNYDVFVQLTDPSGNSVGDPIQVNTDVGGDALAAGIAMAPDGNFVAMYWGAGPDFSEGLYARRYNADGTSLDASEFNVGANIYGGWGNAPTVAIDPDDNFVIAWNDAGSGSPFAQIYSWDLSSVSQPFAIDQNSGDTASALEPQVSLAADGTLVTSYLVDNGAFFDSSAYVQRFSYSPDGNGGIQVSPLGQAVYVSGAAGGSASTIVPVATSDGGFVAVTDSGQSDQFGTGNVAMQRFAADGTASGSLVPVTPNNSGGVLTGAGVDQNGNVYVAWWNGDIGPYGAGGNLYAQDFAADNTAVTPAMLMTPLLPLWWQAPETGSLAVGPDGSLLVGWTDASSTVGARHFDPIVSYSTESDRLTVPSNGGTLSVVSTATTFADSVLWEYTVTNSTSHSLGQFTISGQPDTVTDTSNSLGWTPDSADIGWTAGSSSDYLAPGQTAYFAFTTPSAYTVQPTAAQAGGGTFTPPATDNLLGPVLPAAETTVLTIGTLGGRISVTATPIADGSDLIWDYQVTNTGSTNVGQFTFLDPPAGASNPGSSLGWAFNDAGTGWAAGPDDAPLAPGQTGEFYFTAPAIASGHVAARATSTDGTAIAEGTILGPADPVIYQLSRTIQLATVAYPPYLPVETASVITKVTVYAGHMLWEYRVDNNNYTGTHWLFDDTAIGIFHILGADMATTDLYNSLGWTTAISDAGDFELKAENGAPLLEAGGELYISFTTPVLGIGRCLGFGDELDDSIYYGSTVNYQLSPATEAEDVLAPVPPKFSATLANTIVVNANNDNYFAGTPQQPQNHRQWATVNGVVQTGIPFTRDLNATHLWQPDPNLAALQATWPAGTPGPTYTVIQSGSGRLGFWKDPQKNNAASSADLQANMSGSATISVEGRHESTFLNDLIVRVIWQDPTTGETDVVPLDVTVTPVLNNFAVTPNLTGTFASPGQTINFQNWNFGPVTPIWQGGLKAWVLTDPYKTAAKPEAADFTATAVPGLPRGATLQYVQNLTNIVNGKYTGGAGWVYTPGSGYANRNATLPSGVNFPVLDSSDGRAFYGTDSAQSAPNSAEYTYRSQDSPQTGEPVTRKYDDTGSLNQLLTQAATNAMNKNTQSIDVEYQFRLYFVVSFADGSIYSVAYVDWKATFFAMLVGGVPTINVRQGISADSFVRSNINPGTVAGQTMNQVMNSPDGYGTGWR